MTQQRDMVEITPAMIERGVPLLLPYGVRDPYETVRNIVMAVLGAFPAADAPVPLPEQIDQKPSEMEYAARCQEAAP